MGRFLQEKKHKSEFYITYNLTEATILFYLFFIALQKRFRIHCITVSGSSCLNLKGERSLKLSTYSGAFVNNPVFNLECPKKSVNYISYNKYKNSFG